MAKNPQSPLELNLSEWEFLPDNTSCVDLALEGFKTLISNEVIDPDYFRSEPRDFIQQFSDINNQDGGEEETKINPKKEEPLNGTKSGRSSPKQSTAEAEAEEKEMEIWEGIWGGLWKCRPTAVGALCSIGAAAATICVLALGGREVQHPPHRCRRWSSVAQFRVHSDHEEVRPEPAVFENLAGKLNKQLAVARGMPAMARAANISFGGYYRGGVKGTPTSALCTPILCAPIEILCAHHLRLCAHQYYVHSLSKHRCNVCRLVGRRCRLLHQSKQIDGKAVMAVHREPSDHHVPKHDVFARNPAEHLQSCFNAPASAVHVHKSCGEDDVAVIA
ncbi:hypothetical protein KSP39_PZI022038 [Platanthera zijinensis]|uniref:DUF6821 domain-containing protein n=1 Tax=Platanthera zijinensis TaxID=2320716 RepID=A0AAP0AXV1_9ASPA